MKVRMIFEPRDCWVGFYWRRISDHRDGLKLLGPHQWWQWRVYLCLIPMLPIVFEWWRPRK